MFKFKILFTSNILLVKHLNFSITEIGSSIERRCLWNKTIQNASSHWIGKHLYTWILFELQFSLCLIHGQVYVDCFYFKSDWGYHWLWWDNTSRTRTELVWNPCTEGKKFLRQYCTMQTFFLSEVNWILFCQYLVLYWSYYLMTLFHFPCVKNCLIPMYHLVTL